MAFQTAREFRCVDAEQIELPEESFDVVWSVECTEHLFDKSQFFRRAATWLRPGGTMAICAWLAGDTADASRSQQVHDVCEGFFCPSLGTADDYTCWMEEDGLRVEHCLDWTTASESHLGDLQRASASLPSPLAGPRDRSGFRDVPGSFRYDSRRL